jgi:hypothetical protein
MEYRLKEITMCQALEDYQSPTGFVKYPTIMLKAA